MSLTTARTLRRASLSLGTLGLVVGIGLFGYFIFRPQEIAEGGTLAVAATKAAAQRSVALSTPAFENAVLCQPRVRFDYATDSYAVTTKTSSRAGRYTTRTAGFDVKARVIVADAGGAVLHEEEFTLRDDNTELQATPSGELYEKGSNSAGSGMVGKAAYRLRAFKAPAATPLTLRLELPEESSGNVGRIGALELELYRDVADLAAYHEQNVAGPTWGLWIAGGGLLLLGMGFAFGRRSR
jgi:hypothetical protein